MKNEPKELLDKLIKVNKVVERQEKKLTKLKAENDEMKSRLKLNETTYQHFKKQTEKTYRYWRGRALSSEEELVNYKIENYLYNIT